MEVKWNNEVTNTSNGYFLKNEYIHFKIGTALYFGNFSKAQKAFDLIWNYKEDKLDLDKELK